MKTIGILGGMSAASTQTYYRRLCEMTRDRLGGLHSPQLLIRSLDFADVAARQDAGDWEGMTTQLNTAALALEQGGADLLVLATNTMHKIAAEMMDGLRIPLIHIVDATALALRAQGLSRPALMATAFTMSEDFYTGRLAVAGQSPVLPDPDDQATIHKIIYDELCREIITDDSRQEYEAIAGRLADAGADSLILGCTEIGMLLGPDNCPLPVFDTTELHCSAALDAALA